MFEWFEALSSIAKIYAFIAIPSTVILVIQTVLVLFGIGDAEADVEIDADGDLGDVSADVNGDGGLTLFSVRGIMAFLCVGGWSGLVFEKLGLHLIVVIALSLICGSAALVGIAFLVRALLKLQDNGNTDISNAIGKIGEVYIPIPGEGKGKGKITLVLQEKFSEVYAITQESETIKTGESVRVVSTNGLDLVVVERLKGFSK
ncbi:MAG: hypothetical protein E7665_04485 [Ruminococcaceae bacterium]|nr:hypothetical protein [Oscillospiraceae bacterium]